MLALCPLLASGSHALTIHKPSFYDRAMSAISTPELYKPAADAPAQQPWNGLNDNLSTDPRFRRPWYDGGRKADPKKVGIGLTIAGSVTTALAAALMISNANAKTYQGQYGTAGGPNLGTYILGALLGAIGLGMLIPGIILISR